MDFHSSSGRQTRSSPRICCSPFVSFSRRSLASGPPPAHPKKKKKRKATCQHLLIAKLHHIIGMVETVPLARTTWLRLHDHLRCKITGLTPRDGPNAPLPLFLLCRPLRCLDVRGWQYNYCGVGRDKKGCCLLILPPTEHPAAPHGPLGGKMKATGQQRPFGSQNPARTGDT